MSTVPIGTLPAGTLFEYETKIDGKPYTAIGKVLGHSGRGTPSQHYSVYEDDKGATHLISTHFLVTPE